MRRHVRNARTILGTCPSPPTALHIEGRAFRKRKVCLALRIRATRTRIFSKNVSCVNGTIGRRSPYASGGEGLRHGEPNIGTFLRAPSRNRSRTRRRKSCERV